MPLNIDFVQILLHMLNFVILAGGLTLLLFRPVEKFLKERREHFEALERENAEREAQAEAKMAEYEQKLADAEKEAEAIRRQAEQEAGSAAKACLDEAREKASMMMKAAEREAEERKEHILNSAQTEISELVITAAQKLVSDTVTPERDKALYDEFIRYAEGKDRTGEETT